MQENEIRNEFQDKNNVDNENVKHKKSVLDILNIVLNVIFYIFIVFLLIFSISQIVGSKEDKVKNIFGLGYETVQSDSMKTTNGVEMKKDSFEKGDMLWVKTIDASDVSSLKVGDIVTFWDTMSSSSGSFLNTHRIVDFSVDDKGNITGVITQGDMYIGTMWEYETYKKENPDTYQSLASSSTNFKCQNVSLDNLRAKYIGHWDNFGSFMDWLGNPKKGFIVIIIIALVFVLFEMAMVIKNAMNIKGAKMIEKNEIEKAEMRAELESEKDRMRRELLEELRAEMKEEKEKEEENKDDNES